MNKNRTINELNKNEQMNKQSEDQIKDWTNKLNHGDDRTKEQTLKTEQIIVKSYDRMNKWNNEKTN